MPEQESQAQSSSTDDVDLERASERFSVLQHGESQSESLGSPHYSYGEVSERVSLEAPPRRIVGIIGSKETVRIAIASRCTRLIDRVNRHHSSDAGLEYKEEMTTFNVNKFAGREEREVLIRRLEEAVLAPEGYENSDSPIVMYVRYIPNLDMFLTLNPNHSLYIGLSREDLRAGYRRYCHIYIFKVSPIYCLKIESSGCSNFLYMMKGTRVS